MRFIAMKDLSAFLIVNPPLRHLPTSFRTPFSMHTSRNGFTRSCVEMNSTSERVGWAAEPGGRGTFGLLFSCGATVFLCTYSAIHPNLPGLDDSTSRILWRKIEYMLSCICAPEFFAFSAIMQNLEARSYGQNVCYSKFDRSRLEQRRFT